MDREQRLGCTLASGMIYVGVGLGLVLLIVTPVVGLAGVVGVVVFDRRLGPEAEVVVRGHRWERVTRVEELQRVRFERPCTAPPEGSVEVERATKDGKERCTFEADRWRRTGKLVVEGEGTERASWIVGPNEGCEALGCERSEAGPENLYVVVERVDAWFSETKSCFEDTEETWLRWTVGDRATVTVGAFTRSPYCDTLRQPQSP